MITNLASDAPGFTSNAYLVEGERTALVDVGNDFDVGAAVREHGAPLDVVVLTHSHPDHVGNLPDVRGTFGVPVVGFDPEVAGVDRAIEDGERLALGDAEYVAMHTPGHKDDHVCLYAREAGVLFSGDLVFDGGGFGRTDLAEGDREALIESIDRVLAAVDEDLRALHPGHGPSVTADPYGAIELAGQAARL